MKFRKYNLGKAFPKAVESVYAVRQLVRADVANQFIPPDTRFAILVEAIERDINDSFIEVGAISPLDFRVTNAGVVGRFLGYITASDTHLRIYKMLDLDITKPDLINASVVNELKPQLVVEDLIVNISSESEDTFPTLKTSTKKYRFMAVYPISGNKSYESRAAGVQSGLRSLFIYLKSKGAKVPPISTFRGLLPFIIISLVILAFYLLVLR